MARPDDWIRQAERDIVHAKESINIEHYEWSVLAAQQGAEKAIKALHYELGGDPWGHSIFKFMENLPKRIKVPEEIINAAKNLDKNYITSRYPNGFASGAPEDYYIEKDAKEATDYGEKILKFCKDSISSLRKETE
jgi:HEPN domain-containing protein